MKHRLTHVPLPWLCNAAGFVTVVLSVSASAAANARERIVPPVVAVQAASSVRESWLVGPQGIASLVILLVLVAAATQWFIYRLHMRRMQRLLDEAGNVIDHEVVACARAIAESRETLLERLNDLRSSETRLLSAQAILDETTQRQIWISELDPVTGLPNRRRFDEFLEREWKRASQRRQALSLLLIDVDSFGQFTATYGQSIADDCLRAIADVLTVVVHRSGDLVARTGREEFAVLLCDHGQGSAMSVAREIQAATEQLSIEHATSRVFDTSIVTMSIGVAAAFPDPSSGPSQLLFHADEALYAAHQSGHNCIRSYEETTGTRWRASSVSGGTVTQSQPNHGRRSQS